jgi:hypothetical protein
MIIDQTCCCSFLPADNIFEIADCIRSPKERLTMALEAMVVLRRTPVQPADKSLLGNLYMRDH